ncbi:MAG: fibronectin type III domain-containing protein [Leptothrix sp. (in: b-proteobacteria)]
MTPKLRTSFSGYTEEAFLALVATIITCLTGNLYFPEPWPPQMPTLVQLIAALDAYRVAYQAALTRESAKVRARNEARATLDEMLHRLVPYLEMLAAGRVDVLESTGFLLRSLVGGGRTDNTPLPAPSDFRVVHGRMSGTLDVHVARLPGASSYEVQIARDSGKRDANWQHVASSSSGMHILVDGLTRGEELWVRVRAIGTVPGVWTEPINVIVV